MKVLIVSRSVAHLPYFSSIVDELKLRGHEITILFDFGWSKGANFEYVCSLNGDRSIAVGWLIRRSDSKRNTLFAVREIRNYLNYDKLKGQSPYYKERWGGYIPRFARMLPAGALPFLKFYEDRTGPDAKIVEHIRFLRPDVVMACPANHRFSEEIEYVKAAKHIGIPTVVINYSWDNLTTKGTYHVKPDRMFVWNEAQALDAMVYHDLDNIDIIGAPFFDKWFDPITHTEGRHEFCKRAGIGYLKPYILYLGSSAKIASDETGTILKIQEMFSGVDVLFRPHPANYRKYVWRKEINMFPTDGRLIGTQRDMNDFHVSLKYSVFAFGINNSAMVDAIVKNKPCATLLCKEYARTQGQTEHFRQMKPALYCANTVDELKDIFKRLSKCDDYMASDRAKFVRQNIKPLGIKAGVAAADLLERYYGQGNKHSRHGQGQGARATHKRLGS